MCCLISKSQSDRRVKSSIRRAFRRNVSTNDSPNGQHFFEFMLFRTDETLEVLGKKLGEKWYYYNKNLFFFLSPDTIFKHRGARKK